MPFLDLKFNSGFSREDRQRSTAAIEESVFRRIFEAVFPEAKIFGCRAEHGRNFEMWHRVNHIIDQVFRYADRFSPAEWTMLLVAMVLLGVMCLRGFGSRSNY
jgi:hypothetical protein